MKESNDMHSTLLNKQLLQMELNEIEEVVQTLSQRDPMYEMQQKLLLTQKEDQNFKDQLNEQFNLYPKNLLETSTQISQLFYVNDNNQILNENQMESQYFDQLLSKLYNYIKLQNQQKQIIDHVKSKLENLQRQNIQSQQNGQRFQRILEQIGQIEKTQLKQINLSIDNFHINWMYKMNHFSYVSEIQFI